MIHQERLLQQHRPDLMMYSGMSTRPLRFSSEQHNWEFPSCAAIIGPHACQTYGTVMWRNVSLTCWSDTSMPAHRYTSA
jgi:hypothetical protein